MLHRGVHTTLQLLLSSSVSHRCGGYCESLFYLAPYVPTLVNVVRLKVKYLRRHAIQRFVASDLQAPTRSRPLIGSSISNSIFSSTHDDRRAAEADYLFTTYTPSVANMGVAFDYCPDRPENIDAILNGLDRYNPETTAIFQEYVAQQCENQTFDSYANLALLKL